MMHVHDERRAEAVERLEARRAFRQHLMVYIVINVMLIVIWAASGAGYFWPIWSIAGWGIGIAMHAWSTHGQRPLTEAEIRRETERNLK